ICKKNNPARLGKVFNTLYSFGNLGKNSRASAAKLWCQVLINSTKKNKDEIFLSKASKSLIGSKMSPDENLVDTSDFQSPPNWFPKNGTPYHWFASAWNSLCDEEWLDVMPTRRWVDWSSCVLRTALGLCYLWESRFYRNIAFALVNEVSDSQDIFGLNEPLLSWKGKDTKVSARSINSHLNSLVADGQKARRVLESLEGLNLPAPLKDSHSIGDIINAYKKQISSSQKAQLAGCFNQPRDSDSQATHETIVYCLTNRNEWGESADLYSLLKTIKKVNRVVEPASEWLAVIASLNTNKYTHTSTLSDLKAELRTMCIGFSKSVLVSELERLGLSHILNDADDAIEIKAAFLE
ncbi:MAG: hypothetical protein HN936_01430, partial [Bacteroidetes bacterium]|nr:hypothetical protein [Bacteroidota bacterium]